MRIAFAAVLLLVTLPPAFAGDDDDDLFTDTSSQTKKKSDEVSAKAFDDDDDLGIPTFTASVKPAEKAPAAEKAAAPSGIGVDASGKEALADNWGPKVVATDKDAVIVELPVLYGTNRAAFDGVAYWLVAEAYADGKKVAESRVWVGTDAIADKGPSVQFFRLFTPVPAASGVLEIKVGKAASPAAKPTLLFTRSVPYKAT